MKFPVKPTKPYIKANDQTLTDPSIFDQGTGPGRPTGVAPPVAISSLSAALTPLISSGRLRNHGQNPALQRTPRAAMIQNGVVQVPKNWNSHKNRNGTKAPPRRLHVQIRP